MPDYRVSFRSKLKASTELVDIVGDRLDWGPRADGSGLPAVCMHVTSDPRPKHFTGWQGLRETRIQIDCFSDVGVDEALAIAELVFLAIGGPFVLDGVRFEMPSIEGPETSGNQEERIYVHRARLDVLAWHALV